MVQISLTITSMGDTESGIITVKRTDEPDAREMGTIRFDSAADRKWLLMVLMEFHAYVSLVEESKSFDPSLQKMYNECCKH
jgi:hypothetical protein